MSKRRVVITGMGIVSPIGLDLAANWQSVLAGKSGIGQVTQFDATGFPSTIAGEVKGFEVTDYLTEKDARRMDRFIHLGM
ncbi:MAG: beta-ketoacyl-ACP synthase II, partial [Gammaproteobacteria bacterium]|nr:beta-ketoacyl-ACP synthase II [Gammaproteobacteria bacterium]